VATDEGLDRVAITFIQARSVSLVLWFTSTSCDTPNVFSAPIITSVPSNASDLCTSLIRLVALAILLRYEQRISSSSKWTGGICFQLLLASVLLAQRRTRVIRRVDMGCNGRCLRRQSPADVDKLLVSVRGTKGCLKGEHEMHVSKKNDDGSFLTQAATH
jgi:hypothetical protein